MNWTDKHTDRFAYEMLDPHDLEKSRGWLRNITGASMSQGYYTDLRVTAQLEGVDTGYILNSLIRIHHYIDEEGFHEELGTFFVTDMDAKQTKGVNVESYSLSSMLSRISDDVLEYNYVYGEQVSYLNTILGGMFSSWEVAWTTDGTCSDLLTSASKVYECEDNKLSTIFDVADAINARIDVNAHGLVTVKRYVNPSSKEAIFSLRDDNGTISSEINITEPRFDVANRVLCHYKKDDVDAVAWADRDASSDLSFAQTGKRITQTETVDELSEPYWENLQAIAEQKLANIDGGSRTKDFNCIYFPCEMGEVVTLKDNEGTKKYMLQDRDIDLKNGMPCTLTLKEL